MEVRIKKKGEITRNKQMDFVSRLTFIKGLKDELLERQAPVKEKEKSKKKKKFKQWCMPSQQVGYIKSRLHDFL